MKYMQSTYAGAFNQGRARLDGASRWGSGFVDANEYLDPTTNIKSIRAYFTDTANVLQSDMDEYVAAHNPSNLTPAQEATNQQANAQVGARMLLAGVSTAATARDAAYALVGRSYAVANNEPQATIDGIVDRATAASYIQSTSWWTALTSAQRQLKQLDLEAEAARMQAVIATLRVAL